MNDYREPVGRSDAFASPTTAPRSPRRNNTAIFTPVPRPQRTNNTPSLPTPTPPSRRYDVTPTPSPRRDNAANVSTPTQPPRRYNSATPAPPIPTRPPRRDNAAINVTPTQPPRKYNTVSPPTPTRPARRDNTVTPTTPVPPPRRSRHSNSFQPNAAAEYNNTEGITPPTRLPRTDVTVSPPPIRSRPPVPDVQSTPFIRFNPPFPVFSVNPPIRFRSPIPDATATSPVRPRPPIPSATARTPVRSRPPIPDITASATIPFPPPIPTITAGESYQPTLNVSPSPPVEVGKPVLFEVILWQPPPPGWNLQYRFDFGDGTQTDWIAERQITHTYFSSRKRKLPGPCRNCLDKPRSPHANKAIDKNVDVIPPSNPTSHRDGVRCHHTLANFYSHSHTLANFYFHSLEPEPTAVPTAIPSITSDSDLTAAFAAFENAMALYRRWLLAVAGLASFIYTKWKPKVADCRATRFYPRPDWDAPSEAPRECVHQLRVIFSSQCLCRPGPARD